MPPRGNQPQERVCEANWRRSLCAAKRDPRLRGCTPLRTPKRRSQSARATRTQYYCSRLTPAPSAPFRNSGVPPNPRRGEREAPLSKGAGRVSGLGDSDGPCVAARSRSATRQLGRGGLPPSLAPLVHDDSRQSVGAGHARPATLLCPPSTGIHPLTPAAAWGQAALRTPFKLVCREGS